MHGMRRHAAAEAERLLCLLLIRLGSLPIGPAKTSGGWRDIVLRNMRFPGGGRCKEMHCRRKQTSKSTPSAKTLASGRLPELIAALRRSRPGDLLAVIRFRALRRPGSPRAPARAVAAAPV